MFTKGGQPEGPNRTTVQTLEARLAQARVRGEPARGSGVDAIDLYQIHWPIPDEEIEEGWTTLVELKEEGLVRHIGVSNFSVEQLRRAQAIAPVETLQPPYSLLDREAEPEILPFCEREGIGVIVYSPMASGMLTGKMTRERIEGLPENDWRRRSERFQEPQLSKNLELVERLRARGRAARRLARSRGRRVDAAQPGGGRRDHGLSAARTRSSRSWPRPTSSSATKKRRSSKRARPCGRGGRRPRARRSPSTRRRSRAR